jgi:hypothetical protein
VYIPPPILCSNPQDFKQKISKDAIGDWRVITIFLTHNLFPLWATMLKSRWLVSRFQAIKVKRLGEWSGTPKKKRDLYCRIMESSILIFVYSNIL